MKLHPVFLIATFLCVDVALAVSSWPVSMGPVNNTRSLDERGGRHPPWLSVAVFGDQIASTRIGVNGTVFTTVTNDANLYALRPEDGSIEWSFNMGAVVAWGTPPIGAPALTMDGRIVVGQATIYCLRQDTGTEIWQHTPSGGGVASNNPVLDDGDTHAYFAFDTTLYKIDMATGGETWSQAIPVTTIRPNFVVCTAGVFFLTVGPNRARFHSRATGLELWNFDVQGVPKGAVAITSSGQLIAGSDAPKFFSINPATGLDTWSKTVGADALQATAVESDMVLLGAKNNPRLTLADAAGATVWTDASLPARVLGGITRDTAGRIIVGTGWGTGTVNWRSIADGSTIHSGYGGAYGWQYITSYVTVALDGAVYVSGNTGVRSLHRIVPYTIVYMDALGTSITESNAGPHLIQVNRGGLDTTSKITVDVTFADGTATGAGVDYTGTSTTLTFNSGVLSQTVPFTLVNDALVEGNETFSVVLSNLQVVIPGAKEDSYLADPPHTSTLVTIIDNPPSSTYTVAFSAAGYSASESGGTVTLTLERTPPGNTGAFDVDVSFAPSGANPATAGATDFTAPGAPLTVNFGAADASKTVVVAISGDSIAEPDETFSATLSNVANDAGLGSLGGITSTTVTITDDDPFAVDFNAAAYSVSESLTGVTITLDRTGGTGAFDVVVTYSDGTATGGTDYDGTSVTSISFAAGDTSKTFVVPITSADSVPEADMTFSIGLGALSGPVGPYGSVSGTTSTTVTITDDDLLATPPTTPASAFVGDTIMVVHTATLGSFNATAVHSCVPDAGNGVAAVTGLIGPPTTLTCTLPYPAGERHTGVFNVTLLEDGVPVVLDTSGSGGMPAQARFDQRYTGAAPMTPIIGSPLPLAVSGDGFASGPAAYECNLTAANANVTITATSVVYGTTSLVTCNFDAADTDLIGVQGATLSIKETFPLSQVVAASSVVTVTFVAPPLAAPTGPPASASVSATSFPDLGLVKLTWTQPSLALSGNLPPTVYTVYRDGVPLGTVSAPTLTYTDTTALENTAYTYTLGFNNTLGASPVSTGTMATTPFRRPAVAAVNPPAVPSAGALLVTVTGAHFGASASELLHVTIGGIVNATITSWVSSSSFVFLAPSIAVATGVPVVVYTIHGSSTPSGSIDFAPAPVVLSVDPTTGGRVEGRIVEISGAEFGSSAADIDGITLAGTPCTGIVWINSTSVTCIAGVAPTVFTGAVVVSTKAGGFSAFFLAPSYAYTGPQVSAVDPGILDGSAAATGGAVITLHGAHLGLDRAGGAADLLAINITDTLTTSGFDVPCAPFARAGATEATCTLPAAGLPEGTYSFTVATGTGGQAPSSATLIVSVSNGTATPSPNPSVAPSAAPVPVPVILAVFPGTFPAGQSTQIAITGSNFGSGPGQVTSVTIAGHTCAPVVWISSTEVSCTVSPPSPSTGPVVMTTPSGGVGTSTATFSATPATGGSAPIIVSITPEMHPLTGGTNVTIVAEMLEPLVHVTFSIGSGGDDSSSTATTRLRDRALTLSEQQQGYSTVTIQGNVTSTYEASSQRYTAVVTVPAVPGSEETYADLTVINPAVAKSTTTKNAIYYTDLKCAAGSEYPVGSECRPCPTGAVCPGGNRVWPEPGYWNPGEDAGYVMKCRPESRCLGGEGSACAPGYAGDLCGVCAPGYIRAASGACNLCPATASRIIYLIGDVIVWCLVALTAWASRSNENLQRVVDVVIVLQSASGFASLMNEKFPSWIVAIYDVFYIFMGNYDIFKTDCYGNTTSTFGTRFVSQLVYGVAIGVLMVVGVPLVGFLRMSMSKNTEDQDRKAFVKQYTYDRCVRCFSTWCQVIYMNWTRCALEAVYCVSLPDGTTRLASFPSVQCFKGFHTIAFALSCVILLGLTIGWPVLYSVFVVRGRSTEELYGEPRVMHRWGNGYILLKPSQRYFYINFYFTAVCVSTAYVIFADNPIARVCLAGGAIIVEVLSIFRSSPHAKGRDDYVQLSYDIPMAMLVAVTSAVELGKLSESTIYILALVALAMITFCFLFHFGDLVMHLIGADPDNYELGVADRFLEDNEDDIAAVLDDGENCAKGDDPLGPTGLPNAVAMRHRRRSVFEDVGVALGFMDEDEIVGEEDIFVEAGGHQPGEIADNSSFMAIVMDMLGLGDENDNEFEAPAEAEAQPQQQPYHHQEQVAPIGPTPSLMGAPPVNDEGTSPISPASDDIAQPVQQQTTPF